jgi:hypothetical protein
MSAPGSGTRQPRPPRHLLDDGGDLFPAIAARAPVIELERAGGGVRDERENGARQIVDMNERGARAPHPRQRHDAARHGLEERHQFAVAGAIDRGRAQDGVIEAGLRQRRLTLALACGVMRQLRLSRGERGNQDHARRCGLCFGDARYARNALGIDRPEIARVAPAHHACHMNDGAHPRNQPRERRLVIKAARHALKRGMVDAERRAVHQRAHAVTLGQKPRDQGVPDKPRSPGDRDASGHAM